MKKSKAQIIIFVLVGIITGYAIAFVAYNIATNDRFVPVIVNGIIVALITFVLDFILIVSALGKWGAILNRIVNGGKTDPHSIGDSVASGVEVNLWQIGANDDGPYEPNPYLTDDRKKKQKKERRENRMRVAGIRWENRKKANRTEIIIGVCIFALLGGIAAFMFWLQHRELNRYANDPSYTATVAVAQVVHIRDTDRDAIMYVYSDAEGNKYVLTNIGHLDGYIPSVGSEIDVYYPNDNPSAGMSTDDARMMTVGAVVFLSFGILILMINLFPHNNSVVCFCIGGAFSAVGATFISRIAMYTHMGVLGAMLSNALAFGMTCFVLLGATLALYGVFKLAYNGYYVALYKKSKKV